MLDGTLRAEFERWYPGLALGSYIVGFLNVNGANIATANSGAIFETGAPTPPPVPEPGSLALLGTGLLGLGLVF